LAWRSSSINGHGAQEERHQGRHLEELRSLVEGGLAQQQLVAVVHVQDLGEDDDQRRSGQQQRREGIAVPEQGHAHEQGDRHRDNVRQGKQAPVAAVALPYARGLERLRVEPRRLLGQQALDRPAAAVPSGASRRQRRRPGPTDQLGAAPHIELVRAQPDDAGIGCCCMRISRSQAVRLLTAESGSTMRPRLTARVHETRLFPCRASPASSRAFPFDACLNVREPSH
jgi:hypothetical protein